MEREQTEQLPLDSEQARQRPTVMLRKKAGEQTSLQLVAVDDRV